MSKVYRPYQPEQSELLPPSPREWLPEEHLAYFILDTVKELELKVLLEKYERELRGYPPYHPRMLVGLLLYGYCVGVASSRKLEKRTYEDVAFRIIAAGQHPDHTAIAEFRRRHLKELSGLFVQVLALCQRAGLVKLGHVALDGTKLKANASKHKAMSYERMQQRERELSQKVCELMKAAEEADAAEDRLYGKTKRGDELPQELRRAESRLKKIRQAKAELEAEAQAVRQTQQEAQKKQQDEQDLGPRRCRATRCPRTRRVSPSPRPNATSRTRRAESRRRRAASSRATTRRRRWTRATRLLWRRR
jgi:transposase